MKKGIDDEFSPKCCKCGTSTDDDSNILNTKMKMLISKCGHRYCDQCVKREFHQHREITCLKPGCGKPIKKSQLQDKTKEEQDFARDIAIRKKVLKAYNKTGEDFNTIQEYNAYLEEVEDLIFALLSEDEAEKEAAQKKWTQYVNENKNLISLNDAKKADDERRILQQIEEQHRTAEERRRLQVEEDNKFQNDLERRKAQLLEVALGEREEKDVVKVSNPTTAIPIDQPISADMEAALMGYQLAGIGGVRPTPVVGGKRGPGAADSRQLRSQQQRAGGYDPLAASSRNVDEAWAGALLKLGVGTA